MPTNSSLPLEHQGLKREFAQHEVLDLAVVEIPLNPLALQVGGDHYKKQAIHPVEYIHANKIGYFEGNVIKYVSRWKDKGGLADLEKAKHYIELLIELTQNEEEQNAKDNQDTSDQT